MGPFATSGAASLRAVTWVSGHQKELSSLKCSRLALFRQSCAGRPQGQHMMRAQPREPRTRSPTVSLVCSMCEWSASHPAVAIADGCAAAGTAGRPIASLGSGGGKRALASTGRFGSPSASVASSSLLYSGTSARSRMSTSSSKRSCLPSGMQVYHGRKFDHRCRQAPR